MRPRSRRPSSVTIRFRSPAPTLLLALTTGWLPAAARAEWIEHRKIYGSDTGVIDSFAEVMALDGDRLLVGVPRQIPSHGAAYLFERRAGGPERWEEVAKLTASDAGSDWFFGGHVAIDGDRIAVAATGPDAVYVFDRQADGLWLEVAKLSKPPDPNTQTFANSVAVEGDTLFVGSALDDEVRNDAGAVWVYERDAGGRWRLAAKLTSPFVVGAARFGNEVAVDGGILAVGAYQDSERDSGAGAVHIFERATIGDWIEVAKLTASDGGDGDYLGESLAISGGTVVAGAPDHGSNHGAAYVFDRDASGAWAETAKLTPELDSDNAHIGSSVAISGDLIAVGAPFDWSGVRGSGAAHLFVRGSQGWVELLKLKPAELEINDTFGEAVAVGPATVIVSATGDDDRGFDAGAAYVYLERDVAIALAGACPGEVTLELTGATAIAPIAVVSGQPGETRIASGPCAGTELDLGMPDLLRVSRTDPQGSWGRTGNVSEAGCGSRLQVVDLATCATSGVAAVP